MTIAFYEETEEFFKNKSETGGLTQSSGSTSSDAHFCELSPSIESTNAASMQPALCCSPDGQENYEKICDTKKRLVWPRMLTNIDSNVFTILRENSPRVEIEECL